MIRLPHYRERYPEIKKELLRPVSTYENVDDVISFITSPTNCFSAALQQLEDKTNTKYAKAASIIVNAAISDEAFGDIVHLRKFVSMQDATTSLTRRQVACVIAGMMLGLYGTEYLKVYANLMMLQSLLIYFENLIPEGRVIIKRKKAIAVAEHEQRPLSKFVLADNSDLYSLPCEAIICSVEKTLNRMCYNISTDALFMTYPELNILALHDPLEVGEVITVMGVERFCVVEPTHIALATPNSKYNARASDKTISQTLILINPDIAVGTYAEYTDTLIFDTLHRGLSTAIPNISYEFSVATNLGGQQIYNQELKLIQQYIVASRLGICLYYSTDCDAFCEEIKKFITYIKDHEFDAEDLHLSLREITNEILHDAINGYNSIKLSEVKLFDKIK